MLWVAALVPKPENGVRIWYKPIHQNPTGLPVGAVRNMIADAGTGSHCGMGKASVLPVELSIIVDEIPHRDKPVRTELVLNAFNILLTRFSDHLQTLLSLPQAP